MLRFIWYHHTLCIIGGYVAMVAVAICSPLSFTQLVPLLLLYVALIYALAFLYKFRVTGAYLTKCDPEPYLEQGLWGIRRFRRARTARERVSLANSHICAAAGLFALGRYEEALSHLDALDPSALPPYAYAVYWLNRFNTLLYLNQGSEELDRLLTLAEASQNTSRLSKRQRTIIEQNLQYDRTLLQIQTDGPTDEAVSQLMQHLFAMTGEYQRVPCHFRLANMALALGDTSAARVHLNYVIAHGNKFYVRTQAQELLDKLNAEVPPSH